MDVLLGAEALDGEVDLGDERPEEAAEDADDEADEQLAAAHRRGGGDVQVDEAAVRQQLLVRVEEVDGEHGNEGREEELEREVHVVGGAREALDHHDAGQRAVERRREASRRAARDEVVLVDGARHGAREHG